MNMETDLELVKKCLTLISRIAARGASSPDPDHVRYTLLELTYALDHARKAKGYSVDDFDTDCRLASLHQELDFIDSTSEPMTAEMILKYSSRNTFN
jgi:hypothetical protein